MVVVRGRAAWPQAFIQCTRCCGVGHLAPSCKGQPRCMHCAASHATRNHRKNCARCASEGTPGDSCPHPPQCVNCGAGHRADSPACPRRKKFAQPKSELPSAKLAQAQHPGATLPAGAQGSTFVFQGQQAQQTPGAGGSGQASVHFDPAPGPQAPHQPASIEEVDMAEPLRKVLPGGPSGGTKGPGV